MVEINIQFCTQFCVSLTLERWTECQPAQFQQGDSGGAGALESRAAIRFQIGFCVESPQGSRFRGWEGGRGKWEGSSV